MYDIIIIGGGPAGLSAAITARARGKNVAVLSNIRTESGFYKAREIDNYPGFPGISGAKLSGEMTAHAQGAGAKLITARALAAVRAGGGVSVSYGSDVLAGGALILATGVEQVSLFPGERELLGRGVSYCATCDGMFFRGKRVCVWGTVAEADSEAAYLASIGCEVTRTGARKLEILGEGRVEGVRADGEEIACDGVFIFRPTIAASALLPGLETEKGVIRVDSAMRTNLPGVFAAGDCVGAPYQIAKAAGEGQVAALSAAAYIDGKRGL
jgi:thioredoxin reductase (NADPH)